MGPIGLIIMPAADVRRFRELPFSSTINGSCSNVCPVQIDIHEQIYAWREVMDDTGGFSATKKAAMKAGRRPAQPPHGLPGSRRGRRRRAAGATALRRLQPAQRLGTPPRRARTAQGDLSPVVRPQPPATAAAG